MVRLLALALLALAAPVAAAPLPRSFTVTSFDRVRVEGPYAVTLKVGAAPSAKAEGPAAALDAIDLRVEGRTLLVRQRSAAGGRGGGAPIRIRIATPDLRSAMLLGAGSLEIDRLRGLSVDLSVAGPGSLIVSDMQADRLTAFVTGSGSMVLSGRVKTAVLTARGTPVVDAKALLASELTISAEGSPEVSAHARERARVNAAGTAQVRLAGNPACQMTALGSANIEGCAPRR